MKNTCTTLKTHLKFIPRSFLNKEYHIFDSTQNVDVHKLIHYLYTIIYMLYIVTPIMILLAVRVYFIQWLLYVLVVKG